jgi:large subunit ribosomal protein L5
MAEDKTIKAKKPTTKASAKAKAGVARRSTKVAKSAVTVKPNAPVAKKAGAKEAKKTSATKSKVVSKPKTKAPVSTRTKTKSRKISPEGGSVSKPVAEKSKPSSVVSKSLPRLQEQHRTQISAALIKEFNYTSSMQVPSVQKIIVNIGLGEALTNSKAVESASGDLAAITGQQPIVNRARKSIAGFKIREGQAIGLSVTLRGRRMWEFLDRLISSALPRLRDFRGVSRKAFDGRGNYSLGLREQIIFPEIEYNTIDKIRGLQIVIVTSAHTDLEGIRLLESLGMPFALRETAGAA